MRLTEKRNGIYNKDNVLSNGMPRLDLKEWKLSKLEDIEDELGITLELRDKVENSEKLYCKNKKGKIIETVYYYSRGKEGVMLELPIDFEPGVGIFTYFWKDYGKTWALTKEELK